jgi:ADP-heptose:LPS heptosyltransferase
VDESQVERWRAELGSTDKLRVGIVWAGNPRHSNDHNRSLSLALFAPFLERPGLEFISLQVGPRAADVVAYGATEKIRDLSAQLTDFAQTAALVETLDLVITADTSVAHIAGALGKTVWVLLPFAPDWRWMLNTDQSPWYPSMKLFRQQATGKWDPVIARVTAALSAWVDERSGAKPRKKPAAGPSQ